MTSETQSYGRLRARIFAFAIDYIVIAIYLIVLITLSLIVNSVFPGITQQLFNNPVSSHITGFFILTLPVLLYFALFESSSWQGTWGKRRQHLKVIQTNGERLTRPRALGRNLLKFIPWELAHACIWQISFSEQEPSLVITAGFILVWILVGANIVSLWISPRNQTLYDWIAGTYVVIGYAT